MTAGAPPFIGRLEDRAIRGRHCVAWRTALVDNGIERRRELVNRGSGLDRLGLCGGKLAAPGIFFKVLDPVLGLFGQEFVQVDENRRVVVLAGFDGQNPA